MGPKIVRNGGASLWGGGVGPVPRIFTKLLKVPLTVLRRLMIRLVAYLDDFLIVGRTKEEAI